jgi:glycosyltransferase involved in cell wall biosynthesis
VRSLASEAARQTIKPGHEREQGGNLNQSDLAATDPASWTDTSHAPHDRISVTWGGVQFVNQSSGVVNRELCRELLASGRVELSLLSEETKTIADSADPRMTALVKLLAQPVPEQTDVFVWHQFPPRLEPPPHGHWVVMQPWELGSLPAAWVEPMDQLVDEIWVNSSYVRECYIRSGVRATKVVVIPHGVDPSRYRPAVPPLGLPTDKRFKFLFVGGTIPRKGADILLETYISAFRADDDVCLVIKDFATESLYRGQGLGEAIRNLRADPRNPEILYLNAILPGASLPRLYSACDCLVHPYRGEGFCLPIAEAMACGLPVIVPDHGACLDYCDPSVAYLVPAREVQVPERQVGDLEMVDDISWAEVDRDALAAAMRQVISEPAEARELGSRASARIRQNLTWQRAANLVLERLSILHDSPIQRFMER